MSETITVNSLKLAKSFDNDILNLNKDRFLPLNSPLFYFINKFLISLADSITRADHG